MTSYATMTNRVGEETPTEHHEQAAPTPYFDVVKCEMDPRFDSAIEQLIAEEYENASPDPYMTGWWDPSSTLPVEHLNEDRYEQAVRNAHNNIVEWMDSPPSTSPIDMVKVAIGFGALFAWLFVTQPTF